jgi:hypothetical protein
MKSLSLLFAVWHLLTVCIPNGEWKELLKVAELIEHYHHHQTGHHRTLDFADFLSLHYDNDHHHNEDHDEHENLPFHHHESSISANVLFCIPAIITWLFSPVSVDSGLPAFNYSVHFISAPYFDFWQPPQG